jgi:hypothetical protein
VSNHFLVSLERYFKIKALFQSQDESQRMGNYIKSGPGSVWKIGNPDQVLTGRGAFLQALAGCQNDLLPVYAPVL